MLLQMLRAALTEARELHGGDVEQALEHSGTIPATIQRGRISE